jgi:Protein of unknown function (DUF1566)
VSTHFPPAPFTEALHAFAAGCIAGVVACGCRADAPRDAMTDAALGPHSPFSETVESVDSGSKVNTDAGACSVVDRATWPMPNAKNLPLPNPARLELGDGGASGDEVHDLLTGLVWRRTTSPLVDFTEAANHCQALAAEDGIGWRLPMRIELVSLIDRTYTPTIDPLFGDTPADYFWTQSLVPGQAGFRFSVYFGVGETAWGPEADVSAFTRCVRSECSSVAPEYRIAQDTTRALHTGLVWQRDASTETLTLPAARLACAERDLDGGSARLPTSKELQTLLDVRAGAGQVWLDPEAFPTPAATDFWADEGTQLPPMHVDFTSGFAGIADTGGEYSVRCVR